MINWFNPAIDSINRKNWTLRYYKTAKLVCFVFVNVPIICQGKLSVNPVCENNHYRVLYKFTAWKTVTSI